MHNYFNFISFVLLLFNKVVIGLDGGANLIGILIRPWSAVRGVDLVGISNTNQFPTIGPVHFFISHNLKFHHSIKQGI